MNKDTIEGNWKQLKGAVQARWGKLTDDDLTVACRQYRDPERKNPGALRHPQRGSAKAVG